LYRDAGNYLLASIIRRGIPFFLLPVLTRYLDPAEFGVWSIYQLLIMFAVPVVGMNSHNNITRNFFKYNQTVIATIVFNLIIILITTTSIFLIIITIITFFSDNFFNIPIRWLFTLPIIGFMNMCNQFNLTLLRNRNKSITYGFYEVGHILINLLVALILIVIYTYGWEGMATGILWANIIIGIISIFHIYQSGYLKFNIDKNTIKEILTISLPLVPHAIGGIVIGMSGRLFIDRMVDSEAVGIYSVGFTFGMIVLLFTDSFNKAFSPWLYKQLANITDDKKKRIVKFTYLYNIVVLLLALFITMASYILIKFMIAENYEGAEEYILWIAIGYAIQGMYMMVFPYLVHVGKTNFLGFMTFIAALVNVLANYFLIKLNGPIGAAQSTCISFGVMYLGIWWYSNKIFPMPWLNSINK